MASGTASAVAAPTAEPRRERGLTVAGASKHWGPVQALHDVSLRVDIGEVVGLVGENGAGKSTLVGVVSGTVRPDGGEVTINGTPGALGDARQLAALGVSVVMQEQSLVENLRVYENLFLGAEDLARARARERCSRRRVGRRQLRELADELLQGVGLTTIAADARVGALTFPERQLVEIAKAFVTAELRRQSAVILLDEPTSALSRRETEVLFTLIERWRDRAAFVYVSHVLSDVRRTCTRIVVLKDGVVVDDLANEGIDDSRLHELMVGRVRNADYYREADQQVVDPDLAPAAELIGASVDGAFADVDLAIRPGEIVGLAGVVGSGASDIASAIAGARRLDSGQLRVLGRPVRRWSVHRAIVDGVLYVPPERATDSIFASASAGHNVSIGVLDHLRWPVVRLISPGRERRTVRRLIERMRVKVSSPRMLASELSGGNQQKLVFARWLDRRCRVLVLDDPTRGIDVATREELYATIRALAAGGAAVLLRSESLEELIGLSNRIVVVRRGAATTVVDCPVDAKPDELAIVRHMI